MKKLHYFVGLLLCISCTQNPKNTPETEKESLKIVLECNDTICPDEFLSENIKTEKLPEIKLKYKQKLEPNNISKFKYRPNETVTLIAKQKTKISIPPNSFRYTKSKKTVKEPVWVEVKEYYKKSDFVLANLSSQTKDGLLESRGMIHISAKANGKDCELIDGRQIKVEVPTQKLEKGFEYYKGEFNDENKMIWTLEEPNKENRPNFNSIEPRIIDERRKRVNVSFSAHLTSSDIDESDKTNAFSNWLLKEFIKTFKDNSLNAYHKTEKWNDQYMYKRAISFDFDTAGTSGIEKSNVKVKTDYFLDLKKMLNRVPETVCKEGLTPNKKHRNIIFVTVNVDGRNNFNINKFEKEYSFKNYDDYIDYVSIYANNLNWINVDRPFNFPPEELTPLIVNLGKTDAHDVKLVFKNRNAIMNGEYRNNQVVFNNIPKDDELFIVATKKVNGTKYFTITPTKANTAPVSLSFKKYTKDRYVKALETLNNI